MSHTQVGVPNAGLVGRSRGGMGFGRLKVYMAGSMGPDDEDWRQGWRPETLPDLSVYDDREPVPEIAVTLAGRRFTYTGPYGDDRSNHSFRHGLDSAMFAFEDEIFRRAILGIDRADVVMARIDVDEEGEVDCHGTLAEIGYAYGRRKPVYLMVTASSLIGEDGEHVETVAEGAAWFAVKMAKHVVCVSPQAVHGAVEALVERIGEDLGKPLKPF